MNTVEKKRLIIFIAIAFGFDLLMCIPMWIGYKLGQDLSGFATAQMTYPACGVFLGYLLFGKKEKKIPRISIILFLIVSAATVLVTLLPVAFTGKISYSVYLILNYILLAGNLIAYIMFWACGKEKRRRIGLSRNNVRLSALFVALYIVLFYGQMYISLILQILFYGADGDIITNFTMSIFNVGYIRSAAFLLAIFPISFIGYLGEEYGWRYYLQPILQKKYGLRAGVVILGIVWGLWHVGLDFMLYTRESGPQMLVRQVVACIAFGIFYGYAYMKTKNIWALTLIHFINNNFLTIGSGGVINPEAIQNNTIAWSDVMLVFVCCVVFWIFIFAPSYNKKNKEAVLSEYPLFVEDKALETEENIGAESLNVG